MTTRTILAACTGWTTDAGGRRHLSPVQRHAFALTGVSGRALRVVYLNTAGGDQREDEEPEAAAAREAGGTATHVRLFGRTVADLADTILGSDLVWVGGGSVVNLLAVWRAHGLDDLLRQAWEAGVVLAGTSAGALCWHSGGPTSAFGDPEIQRDGLGLLPGSLGVHYDSQPERRPLLHDAVARGVVGDGFGLDEGTAVHYVGTDAVEFLTESDGATVHRVTRTATGIRETAMASRLLVA